MGYKHVYSTWRYNIIKLKFDTATNEESGYLVSVYCYIVTSDMHNDIFQRQRRKYLF